MKKFIVIATMIFSAAAMTACGNNTNNKDNENTTNVPENQDTDDNQNDLQEDQNDVNNTDANDNNLDSDNQDINSDNEDTNANENNDNNNEDDNDKTNNDKTDDENSNSQEELIETGKEPDIKVNKKGRFNGRYEGSDGCIYEFTKKGRLTITSDSEVIEYTYQLDGDRLSMVTIDETMGIGRQITLLEDGTYLLDDTLGNQVILTYLED